MEGYQTEEQQVADLAKLWRKYGRYVLIGVLTIGLVLSGNYLFAKHKSSKNREASVLYEKMMQVAGDTDKSPAEIIGKQLLNDYKNTPYALLSGMLLAKFMVHNGELDQAIVQLQQVISKSYKKDPLWNIAKVRLARLLHYTEKSELALKELDVLTKDYVALYEEVRGDIYIDLHDNINARNSYKQAIVHSVNDNKTWIVAKLSEISGADDTAGVSEQ